jgi:hypothetical protein
MQNNNNSISLIKLPEVELYKIQDANKIFLFLGPLEIVLVASSSGYQDSVQLRIGSLNYILNKDVPLLESTENDSSMLLVLPNNEGHYGIKIPSPLNSSIVGNFRDILIEHATVYHQDSPHTSVIMKKTDDAANVEYPTWEPVPEGLNEPLLPGQQGEQEVRYPAINNPMPNSYHPPLYQNQINQPQIPNLPNVHLQGLPVIQQGIPQQQQFEYVYVPVQQPRNLGTKLRGGLISLAEQLATGIRSGGQYVETKWIKEPRVQPVSDDTLAQTAAAKGKSKNVLTSATNTIQKILKSTGKKADLWAAKLQNTQMAQNYTVQQISKTGKEVVQIAGTTLDGLVDALCILAQGVGDATTGIINKKYGERAGIATRQGLDAVGNIGLIVKAYKNLPPPENQLGQQPAVVNQRIVQ